MQEAGIFEGGNGTPDDPFLIATASQLDKVRRHMAAHFKLVADIDLSEYKKGKGWDPIGVFIKKAPFNGTFDGNGYAISNLTVKRPGEDYIGLFAYTGKNAELKDITLKDVTLTGTESVGSLVGENHQGTITNCRASGSISGESLVGGLVGCCNRGVVRGCRFSGEIKGKSRVGGLAGGNTLDAVIEESHVEGSVTGKEEVGGLVGWNWEASITVTSVEGEISGESYVGGMVGKSTGIITESYARVQVSGGYYVAGLVGWNQNSNITDSYAVGKVAGKDKIVAGLVGWNRESSITNSYFGGTIAGFERQTGGLVGYDFDGDIVNSYYCRDYIKQSNSYGSSRTEEEMKKRGTFEGWNFEETWDIQEDKSFPFLRWE